MTGNIPPAAVPIMKHMPTFHQSEGIAPQIEVPTNITATAGSTPCGLDVGDDAPHERTDDGAGKRGERTARPSLAACIFVDHPGNDETEAGGLHDVDDERDEQHAIIANARGSAAHPPAGTPRFLRGGKLL